MCAASISNSKAEVVLAQHTRAALGRYRLDVLWSDARKAKRRARYCLVTSGGSGKNIASSQGGMRATKRYVLLLRSKNESGSGCSPLFLARVYAGDGSPSSFRQFLDKKLFFFAMRCDTYVVGFFFRRLISHGRQGRQPRRPCLRRHCCRFRRKRPARG